MRTLAVLVLVALYCVTRVASHSWLVCADYRAELSNDAQDFDFSNCVAYARDYFDSNNADVFASSTHYTSNSGDTIECKTAISDPITDGYNDEYPYAEWTPGSTYRLVWPAKNHAIGEECGETSSVDGGIGVYANMQVNPTSDLTDLSEFSVVYDWHAESGETFENNKGIEGVPFANCMDYCSDTDASPCWGDITIPENMFTESGFYTFIWYWQFGSNYVSCFDVYIDVNGETQTPPPEGTSSGGSASVDENVEYHFVAPICYDGADYDEDTVIDTLEDLFSGVGAEFDVIEVDEHDTLSKFNVTVETYTTSIGVVNPGINNGTACSRLVAAFGSGTCNAGCNGGTITNQLNSGSGSGGSSDDGDGSGFVVALVVVLVIIFVVVAIGLLLSKRQQKNGGGAQVAMNTSPSQTNIIAADGNAATGTR